MSSPVVVVSKFEDFKTGEEDEEYIVYVYINTVNITCNNSYPPDDSLDSITRAVPNLDSRIRMALTWR